MVERQKSRQSNSRRSRWILVGAGVISLVAVATIFTDSTLTVQADSPLARPASTLLPAGPPASLSATVASPAKPQIQPNVLSGLASWYGAVRQGHWTASGERFDMFAMTAAHNSLPFGTLVRVVDTRSGKSVDVRINDRGVLPGDRVIDLSYEAARDLGILRSGVISVKLEVLSIGPKRRATQ
jgi:rare lipoprotein A